MDLKAHKISAFHMYKYSLHSKSSGLLPWNVVGETRSGWKIIEIKNITVIENSKKEPKIWKQLKIRKRNWNFQKKINENFNKLQLPD